MLPTAAIANPGWDGAKAQLAKGNSAAALIKLEILEPEYAGDPDFDYLFGQAALAADQIGVAIMALERVVLVDPSRHDARLLLAQAFEQDQQPDLAIAQFEVVALQGNTEQVEIAEREKRRLQTGRNRGGMRWHLLASTGFDSNANSGSDLNSFFGVPLAQTSQAQGAAFLDARLKGKARQQFDFAEFFGSLQYAVRKHESPLGFVDTHGGQFRLGGLRDWRLGRSSAVIRVARNELDSEFNNQATEFALSHTFTQQTGERWNLLLSSTDLRFGVGRSFESGRFSLGGISYDRDLNWPVPLQARLSIFAGQHEPEISGATSERSLQGAQLSITGRAANGGWIRFQAGYSETDYDNPFLGGTANREDDSLDLRLEAAEPITARQLLLIEVRHQSNNSELSIAGPESELFSFSRNSLTLSWRYELGVDP